jgi:hypothetical protein
MAQLALAWDGQWFIKVYDKFGWDVASSEESGSSMISSSFEGAGIFSPSSSIPFILTLKTWFSLSPSCRLSELEPLPSAA